MKTVIYRDLENAAPTVEYRGVAFVDGDAVEVEDDFAASLEGNRFFEFKGDPDTAKGDAPRRGRPPTSRD